MNLDFDEIMDVEVKLRVKVEKGGGAKATQRSSTSAMQKSSTSGSSAKQKSSSSDKQKNSSSAKQKSSSSAKQKSSSCTDDEGDSSDQSDAESGEDRGEDERDQSLAGSGENCDQALRLGTFFSGIETPSVALAQADVPHTLEFAIEILPHLRTLIASTWKPKQLHADVHDVVAETLPPVDIVVGGPPCQPFCRGGKNLGLADERGPLTYAMVEMVEARERAEKPLPKAIVMEQAKTLLIGHRNIYKSIKRRLQKLKYKVKAKVLNTKLNGLPQSRERAYIVAYKAAHGRKFRFPRTCKAVVPLKHIFERRAKDATSAPLTTANQKKRLRQARRFDVMHIWHLHIEVQETTRSNSVDHSTWLRLCVLSKRKPDIHSPALCLVPAWRASSAIFASLAITARPRQRPRRLGTVRRRTPSSSTWTRARSSASGGHMSA